MRLHAKCDLKAAPTNSLQAPPVVTTHLFELVAERVAVPGTLNKIVQPLKPMAEAQRLQPQQLQAPATQATSTSIKGTCMLLQRTV
jgi:hypothetical protein